jgi:hypothetical protein
MSVIEVLFDGSQALVGENLAKKLKIKSWM